MTSARRHRPSHLIQGAGDIDPAWFDGVECVGITGRSVDPDYVIDRGGCSPAGARPSAAAEGGSYRSEELRVQQQQPEMALRVVTMRLTPSEASSRRSNSSL